MSQTEEEFLTACRDAAYLALSKQESVEKFLLLKKDIEVTVNVKRITYTPKNENADPTSPSDEVSTMKVEDFLKNTAFPFHFEEEPTPEGFAQEVVRSLPDLARLIRGHDASAIYLVVANLRVSKTDQKFRLHFLHLLTADSEKMKALEKLQYKPE